MSSCATYAGSASPSPAGSTPRCCWRWPSGCSGADAVLAVLGVSPSLAADERAAAHRVARGHRRDGGRGRPPTRATGRPTGPTAPTAASTARTSCSRGSTTRSSAGTRSTRSPTARTPTTRAGPTAPGAGPPPRTGCCARSPTPGWTRRAVRAARPGVGICPAPTSRPRRAWPRGSRTIQPVTPEKLRPDRAGREPRCAGSASATCGCATTATIARLELPGRRPGPGGRPNRCAIADPRRPSGPPASATSRSISAGIQSGAFTLPLVRRPVADAERRAHV